MQKLQLIQGPGAGAEYPVEGEGLVLGRQPDVDVQLDAPEVSRRHARVTCADNQCYIEDLGSSNGTYLNTVRVNGRVELHAQDRLKIGPYVFVFDAPLAPEPGLVIQAEVTAHTSNAALFKDDNGRRLQAVMEISQQIGRTLDLDELLPKLLDQLLRLFLQADRAFILMREGDHLVIRSLRNRAEGPRSGPVYSRSVVNRVLVEGIGVVAQDARFDDRFAMTQTLKAMGIRSFMCAPLKTPDGQAMGVLQVDRFGSGSPFTEDDLHLLTTIALQASIVLENASLHEDLIRQERIKRDLALAREIQEGFLPQEVEAQVAERLDVYGKVFPARDVSGDFYDYFRLDERRLIFTIADVSGKGMPAALFMTAVRTLGRHLASSGTSPAESLQRLNDSVAADNPAGLFVTMLHGTVNLASGEVVLSCGGHPPALVCRADGRIEPISIPPGRLLGFSPDKLPLAERRFTLAPRETLVMYTDGLTEAVSPDRDTMFGGERLVKALGRLHSEETLEEWTNELKAIVDRFTEATDLHDDVTLLMIRRRM